MSKQQLIEHIRRHNPTANSEFLIDFDEQALNQYLEHLKYKVGPRNGQSVWVRRGDTPAIIERGRRGER